jgi:hypothetical protein
MEFGEPQAGHWRDPAVSFVVHAAHWTKWNMARMSTQAPYKA